MSRKRKKMDTRAENGEGLTNPFAALDSAGLPEGEVPDESDESGTGREVGGEPHPAGKRRLVIRRETAHRGGRTVVVVSGFEAEDSDGLADLAHDLKRACGTGGTVKGLEIEIQGEKALEVAALLKKRGYRLAGIGV